METVRSIPENPAEPFLMKQERWEDVRVGEEVEGEQKEGDSEDGEGAMAEGVGGRKGRGLF